MLYDLTKGGNLDRPNAKHGIERPNVWLMR